MRTGGRVPVVQTRHPTDERIAQPLAGAFSPHRCTVEFQDDRRKVALRVRGPTGAEFVVEGKRLNFVQLLASRQEAERLINVERAMCWPIVAQRVTSGVTR